MRSPILRWPVLVTALALPALSLAADAPSAARDDTQRQLAEAQQRLDAAARDVAELSSQLGRRTVVRIDTGGPGGPGRPVVGGPTRLGDVLRPRVLLGVGFGSGEQRDGVRVLNISPGGPAAEAGIREGDLIVSVAGTDLTKDSNPGRALMERVNQLQPDQKVPVGVVRDGKPQTFTVTLRPAPVVAAAPAMPVEGMPPGVVLRRRLEAGGMPGPQPAPGLQQFQLLRDGLEQDARFRDLEFATLSEKLGSYFGVKTGVLVVRAGVNSPFQLQDGDVVLSIDGREVTTAQHVGRILRSYLPGEQLKLRVQRDRKARDIDVTLPADGRGGRGGRN